MVDATKDVFREEIENLYLTIVEINSANFSHFLINDTKDLKIGTKLYKSCGFTYLPPEVEQADSTSQMEIDDTNRVISRDLQQFDDEVTLKIGLISNSNPSIFLEGPFYHKIDKATISSKNQISLELLNTARLDFSPGIYSYSLKNFPGLFG